MTTAKARKLLVGTVVIKGQGEDAMLGTVRMLDVNGVYIDWDWPTGPMAGWRHYTDMKDIGVR